LAWVLQKQNRIIMKHQVNQQSITSAKQTYVAPRVWSETIQIENGFAASGAAAQFGEENEFGEID
jgi:hypothetical protein